MISATAIPAQTTSHLFWRALAIIAVTKGLLVFWALPAFLEMSPDAYNVNRFSDGYDLIATNLLEGNGYKLYADTSETLMRTPGYVLILAALFALAGKSLFVVQLFNIVMSLAGGWGLYHLARKITGSDMIAVTAAAIFLLYPATILAESRGGLESVFTACAIFLLIAVYRALASYRYRDFLIVGALFGLCLLIKSTLAFALPLLFLWLLVAKVPRPGLTKLVALFAAASAVATLALSPWIIRNYSVSGKFIPTITGGGTAAFQGLWVVKHGGSGKPHMELLNEAIEEEDRIAREMGFSFKPGFFPQFYSVDDEIRFYDELGRRTRVELMASPQLALKFVGYNAIGFWIQGRTPRATVFNAILVIPFVAVCVIGLVIAVRRRFPVAPTILLIAAYFAPHVPILGVARYHTPIVPFLAIFAAVALVNMFSRSTGVFR